MVLIFKAYTAFFFCVLTFIARDGFMRNAEKQQLRYVNSYFILVDVNISWKVKIHRSESKTIHKTRSPHF